MSVQWSWRSLFACCMVLAPMGKACKGLPFYDHSLAFRNRQWPATFEPTFSFFLPQTAPCCDVVLILESQNNYPYQNLHLRCRLGKGSTPTWQETFFRHYALFEAETGQPLGKEQGTRTRHTFLLMEKRQLEAGQCYTVTLTHLMRTASLPGLCSVRVVVRNAEAQSTPLVAKSSRAASRLLLPKRLFTLAKQSP